MIVILLEEQPLRFSELHRELQGIAKKVVMETLRALERDGLLARIEGSDGHQRYALTGLGHTLHEPLIALQLWAQAHVDDVQDAQDRYDAAKDDQVLEGAMSAGDDSPA